MKKRTNIYVTFISCLLSAHAYGLSIGKDLPVCRTSTGSAIPRNYHQYSWARGAKSTQKTVSGKGDERIDGSRMYEWHTFIKADVNQDGLCDWFVTSTIPLSTGGDRDSINTIYLASTSGWKRIGASRVPRGQPDGLGRGDSDAQQSRFNYFDEGPYLLKTEPDGHVFILGYFESRNTNEFTLPGYQMYVWNEKLKRLTKVDKWAEGSEANQVYEYFRKNNAYAPANSGHPDDHSGRFSAEVEKAEIAKLCKHRENTAGDDKAGQTSSQAWRQYCTSKN